MIVYKYIEQQWAQKALEEKRLKGSIITKLNDPFELLPNIRKVKDRILFEGVKEKISNNKILFCFSETFKSPPMWAHYADNHKGVCLGFKVNQIHLKKVCYDHSRLKRENFDSDNKLIAALLRCKSKDWEYEKERRMIISKRNLKNDGEHYFFEFIPGKFQLHSIHLGIYNQTSVEFFEQLLKNNGYHDKVLVKIVKPTRSTFSLNDYIHTT